MFKRGTLVLGLVLAVSSMATACGSDAADEGPGAPETTAEAGPTVPPEVADRTGVATVDIAVVDNDFEPASFRVDPGTDIVFTNNGETKHNVTPVDEGAFTGIAADDLEPGASGSVVIDQAGTYFYFCSLHGTPTRGQNGVIIVGQG